MIDEFEIRLLRLAEPGRLGEPDVARVKRRANTYRWKRRLRIAGASGLMAVALLVVLDRGASRAPSRLDTAAALETSASVTEGVDAIIYLQPDASDGATSQLRQILEADADVRAFEYFDHDAAYDEFARLFADQPELVAGVTPDILPTSFRLDLNEACAPLTAEQAVSGVRVLVRHPNLGC